MFICVATVLAVPFLVSFHTLLDSSLPFIDSTLAAVETMFLLDIYNNFRTAYYSATRASFVLDRRLIASRYARSHLLTDVLAAIPVTCFWKLWNLTNEGTDLTFTASVESLEVVDAYSLLQCGSDACVYLWHGPSSAHPCKCWPERLTQWPCSTQGTAFDLFWLLVGDPDGHLDSTADTDSSCRG